MKLLLLPALVAASGLPVRRPLFASLPSHKPESPSWLLAATGRCTHRLYTELDEPGYEAHVEFEFLPSTTMQFADAPERQAFEIITPEDQIVQLADESWSYKNVALLEPDANGTDWAISTFEIDEHGISEGGGAVHYGGRVIARSSNFPGVRTDTFVCQLFVDSARKDGHHNGQCVIWGGPIDQGDVESAGTPCKEGSEECFCWGINADGTVLTGDEELTCRSYGTGAGWRSMCCKCNEQMIGGTCVDCTKTPGVCEGDC